MGSLLAVFFLVGLSLVGDGCGTGAARGGLGGGDPPAREFDGQRAFVHLERQVAFGPRVPGTVGHATTRQYLIDALGQRVDELTTQDLEHPSPGGPLPLTNIIGVLNPFAPSRVLLAAHWDTRPTADQERDRARAAMPIDGANDGASGVAVLLEVARALAVEPPSVGVVFALLDGEDYGPGVDMMFLGSRAVVSALGEPRPTFGILLDMVGDADLEIPYEPFSLRTAPRVVELVWGAAEAMEERAFVRRMGPEVLDDHYYLTSSGVPTIDIIDFSYPHWHTLGDTVDKTSPESLAAVGRVLLQVVRSLPDDLTGW